MERYIERVKSNIQAKESPLKLAETRLAKRSKESHGNFRKFFVKFSPSLVFAIVRPIQYNIDLNDQSVMVQILHAREQ